MAKGRRSEEIGCARLKMSDLALKYSGILGLISRNKTAEIIAESSTSLQLSVSDMLTHVNLSTFAVADPRYGG